MSETRFSVGDIVYLNGEYTVGGMSHPRLRDRVKDTWGQIVYIHPSLPRARVKWDIGINHEVEADAWYVGLECLETELERQARLEEVAQVIESIGESARRLP